MNEPAEFDDQGGENNTPEIFRNGMAQFPDAFVKTRLVDGTEIIALRPVRGQYGEEMVFYAPDGGVFKAEIVLSDGGELMEAIGGSGKLPEMTDWNAVSFGIGRRATLEKEKEGSGFGDEGKFSFEMNVKRDTGEIVLVQANMTRLDLEDLGVKESLVGLMASADEVGKQMKAKLLA